MSKFRKGKKLVFKNRTETIEKGSSDRISGMVTTDQREYSVDFLCRWLENGFVKLE